ncbi:MAG: hypothetical protein H6729_15720 [Deltaproteobacteria bacterium]|nr:hypothetical protein [Deltaproteobacteria bacterium]
MAAQLLAAAARMSVGLAELGKAARGMSDVDGSIQPALDVLAEIAEVARTMPSAELAPMRTDLRRVVSSADRQMVLDGVVSKGAWIADPGIYAPYPRTTVRHYVDERGTHFVELGDLDSLAVKLMIPSQLAHALRAGDLVPLRTDSPPGSSGGRCVSHELSTARQSRLIGEVQSLEKTLPVSPSRVVLRLRFRPDEPNEAANLNGVHVRLGLE